MMTTNRRRAFLAGLTAAFAAPVAVAAMPAVAATTSLAEAPELLELGVRLDTLHRDYRTAARRVAEARQAYERLHPALPEEIIWRPEDCRHDGRLYETGELQYDVDGKVVSRDGQPLRLYRANLLQAHVIRYEVSRHAKEGKRLRRIARLAKKHETEIAAAYRESRLREAMSAARDVATQIQDIAYDEILKIRPRSPRGVTIYATALLALDDARIAGGGGVSATDRLGVAIAQALVGRSAEG